MDLLTWALSWTLRLVERIEGRVSGGVLIRLDQRYLFSSSRRSRGLWFCGKLSQVIEISLKDYSQRAVEKGVI